ncbi:transposase [Elysia marginata]|uniref:Transposase n=1 Tax=Elysia marginata TaxID=1093978 RepID=A0AAV4J6W1_9GAST|nr:transposase [Elysia marginata]
MFRDTATQPPDPHHRPHPQRGITTRPKQSLSHQKSEGKESLSDRPRPGLPKSCVNEQTIGCIKKDIYEDPHISVRELSDINGLSRMVKSAINEQRPKVSTSRTLLLHDNAGPHTARATTQSPRKLGIQVLPHPAYSPDLAPCDFWLFPILKERLAGRKFDRIQDLAKAENSKLRTIPGEDYQSVFFSDIAQYIAKQRWKRAGHVARLQDNRWTLRVTEWQPRNGKRSRGRQARRWRDDIVRTMGNTWTREAKDKEEWRRGAEGLILQWMDGAESINQSINQSLVGISHGVPWGDGDVSADVETGPKGTTGTVSGSYKTSGGTTIKGHVSHGPGGTSGGVSVSVPIQG